jgi:hypothetical protein
MPQKMKSLLAIKCQDTYDAGKGKGNRTMRTDDKTKRGRKWNLFISVNLNWWSIGDVKITFAGEEEADVQEIRELLDAGDCRSLSSP